MVSLLEETELEDTSFISKKYSLRAWSIQVSDGPANSKPLLASQSPRTTLPGPTETWVSTQKNEQDYSSKTFPVT